MDRKKITWITPDYFVDCDFNPDVLSELLKQYDIRWIIILPVKNARFGRKDFEGFQNFPNLKIEFIETAGRNRNPGLLLLYMKLYFKIVGERHDLVYLNIVPDNPYIIPLYWLLNKRKTIFAVHDGGVKMDVDAKFRHLIKICGDLTYPFVRNVTMFSVSQATLFHSNYPKVKIYHNLLGLKDYGHSDVPKYRDCIGFVCFGTLHEGKNIDLLIEAACNVYAKGYRGFTISINGSCQNWEFYQAKIRYPDLFKCTIRTINNQEIPELFARNHYMVLPYRVISQSGALKVAFNYNIPVIVSDLPGFTDEVKDGVNGYIFKRGSATDLENVLIKVLENHKRDYDELIKKMKCYTQTFYSVDTLNKNYTGMFERVLKNLCKP